MLSSETLLYGTQEWCTKQSMKIFSFSDNSLSGASLELLQKRYKIGPESPSLFMVGYQPLLWHIFECSNAVYGITFHWCCTKVRIGCKVSHLRIHPTRVAHRDSYLHLQIYFYEDSLTSLTPQALIERSQLIMAMLSYPSEICVLNHEHVCSGNGVWQSEMPDSFSTFLCIRDIIITANNIKTF